MAFFACPAERSVVRIIPAVASIAIGRRGNPRDIGLLVARMAMQSIMRARQRVAGLLVVIEEPACPTIGVVTARTVGAEPTDMVRILVAARASTRRILERLGSVAFLAGHHRMQSDQWEPRQIMIEDDLLPPARLLVALLAIAAQLTPVRIILAMAGDARHGQFIAIQVAGVALLALELGVAAAQRKLGCLVVVKADRGPRLGGVTGLTIGAVVARMLVLQAVTGDARPTQILVSLAHMAFRTRDFAVRADQWESRLAVIERSHPRPSLLAVTAVTLLAQSTLVRIVCPVTVETAPGGLTEFPVPCMAAVATRSLVGPHQREVGKSMVEGFAVELDDVEWAPLVLCVTRNALTLRRLGAPAMEAALALPICGNRLVARQTKRGLRLAREGLVAAVAVLLQLCVPTDQWPRHHQLFEDAL